MQYTDPNEFQRRMIMLEEVMRLHPEVLKAVKDDDRSVLQRYFLEALQADDITEYRQEVIKSNPKIEIQANKAYERFMAEAGMSETLLPVH